MTAKHSIPFAGLALAALAVATGPAQAQISRGLRGTTGDVHTFEGLVYQVDRDRQTLTMLRGDGNSLTGADIRGSRDRGHTGGQGHDDRRPVKRVRPRMHIEVPSDVQIFLDHTRAKLRDLKPGMRVRVYATQRIEVVGQTTRSTADRDISSGVLQRDRAKDTISTLGRLSGRGTVRVRWVAVRIEASSKPSRKGGR
jgi:hypothetical protein